MNEPSGDLKKYRALVEHMKTSVVSGLDKTGANPLNGVMLMCDVTAEVILELYETTEQRQAALDIFLTRLGNVMDRGGVGKGMN